YEDDGRPLRTGETTSPEPEPLREAPTWTSPQRDPCQRSGCHQVIAGEATCAKDVTAHLCKGHLDCHLPRTPMINAHEENDPFWTSGDLTDAQRRHVANQTLPTLEELCTIGQELQRQRADVRPVGRATFADPCYNLSVNYTIHALTQAGYPLQNVLWLQFQNSRPTGVTFSGDRYIPVDDLRKDNMSVVNVQYTELTDSQIEEYQASNISIHMWTVNSEWMYSLCWCMGISSVTSDSCHKLKNIQAPIWHLVPSSYLILWVTVDVLSAVIIITVFIVQRIRLYGTSFSPETISLNSAARSSQGHRSRNMKEKLLYNMTDGDLVEEVDVRAGHGGVVNQPASSYSMASINNDPYSSRYHNGNTFPDSKYEVE
ncbi:glycerophosphodiester phosphodiesterase domain-containing protein 5-like, partial [Haliotis rubra]|uniref:glycerophosphodiester phosphodiesterase domain-containing protein 5-like n=1 Tax=Haliotis rubra TaxID=36100 RepID=UPI001EE5F614